MIHWITRAVDFHNHQNVIIVTCYPGNCKLNYNYQIDVTMLFQQTHCDMRFTLSPLKLTHHWNRLGIFKLPNYKITSATAQQSLSPFYNCQITKLKTSAHSLFSPIHFLLYLIKTINANHKKKMSLHVQNF